ncbi:hypothetical protein JEQ12_018856 [Ovis aries]|uniref:Uncharacterized protein n=1 Tax=Ovis aries TaxID=9940 RepID=A0A836D392_SHEEP|nr:hypothetical protein JEQ12_018856 [Ovis aries]
MHTLQFFSNETTGTLRSLPVQVRLLLVLAAAGGAQRGARARQFSSPLLLLIEKSMLATPPREVAPKRRGNRVNASVSSSSFFQDPVEMLFPALQPAHNSTTLCASLCSSIFHIVLLRTQVWNQLYQIGVRLEVKHDILRLAYEDQNNTVFFHLPPFPQELSNPNNMTFTCVSLTRNHWQLKKKKKKQNKTISGILTAYKENFRTDIHKDERA